MPNQDIREPVADDIGENKSSHHADRRALVGKGSIYTLATAAQLTGALLVQPALSRLLPEAEYGRVALAIVVTNLLGLVIAVGIPGVITREHFITSGRATARTAVTVGCGFALLLGGIALVTGPLWASPLHGFDLALAVGAATAISYSMIACGQALIRAQGRASRFVMVVIVNVVGGQLAGIAAIVLISDTAATYLLGVAAGSVVGAVLTLAWVKPTFVGITDKSAINSWFQLAWPTIPHSAALFLMAAGDRFIIEIQRGQEAVAAYSLAYLIGALGVTLVAAANNAWVPLIFGAPEERRWQLLAATTTDLVRLVALLAGALAVTAPLALWIVADPNKYDVEKLTPVVAITALAAVPYVLYLASSHAIFWLGKTKILMWVTPLAVLLNLGVKAVVLPSGGFVAAAVVTVGAYLLLALLLTWQQGQLVKVPWTGRALPAGGAVVLCVVGALLPFTWWGHALRAVITVGLLLAMMVIVRRIMVLRRPATG